jgi:hypothetical protein
MTVQPSKKGMRFLKITGMSILSIILLMIVILIAAHGSFMTKTYLEPWSPDYHKKFDDPRLQVIAHGLLAPNAHNMQSWRIVLDPADKMKFKLYLDETRLLPATDPYHRQSVISQGTFIELAHIAARKLGYETDIKLFPDGEFGLMPADEQIRNKPMAEIALFPSKSEGSDFYTTIFERVTTRTPYLENPLSQEQIERLTRLNDFDNIGVIVFQNPDELSRLKELAVKGVDVESRLSSTMNESHVVLRFNEYQKNKHRNGLTMSSQGFSRLKQFFIESGATLFPPSLEQEGKIWREAEGLRIEKTPAYAMIFSDKNDRITQVNVGRLYSRMQLSGAAMGLSMQPTMQVTEEYPEMKALYEEVTKRFVKNGQTVQMLFRVGMAVKKVDHSPRRDVMDLIDNKN